MNQLQFRLITAAVAALSCLILGILAYRKDKSSPLHKYFAFFNLSLGIWNISDFAIAVGSADWALFLDRLSYVWATLIVPSFVFLSSEFAHRPVRSRWVKYMIWGPGIFLLGSAFSPWLIEGVKTDPNFVEIPGPLYGVFALYLLWWIGYGVVQVFMGYRAAIGGRKNQLRYVFLGFFFGFLAALDYLITMAFPNLPPYYYVLEATYTTIIFFAIVKHRLMDINLVFRYVTIYLLFAISLAIPFSAIAILLRSGVIVFLCFVIALIVGPIIEKKAIGTFRRFVDKLPPFRGRYQFLTEVPGFQKAISNSANVKHWAQNVVDSLNRLIEIENAVAYIYDASNEMFMAAAVHGTDLSQMVYSSPKAGDPLIKHLMVSHRILQKEYVDFEVSPSDRQGVIGSLSLIKAQVCIPFFNGEQMIGFVSIGRKFKRGNFLFKSTHIKIEAMRDIIESSPAFSRNFIYVHDLLLKELSGRDLKTITAEDVSNGFNRLVNKMNWAEQLPKQDLVDLRSEGLALWNRLITRKTKTENPLTPLEMATLNASILAWLYRKELINFHEEESFNDEDLKAIWGLIQGAESSLMVILVTLAGQMKTAEWAHDLRHPFLKGSFKMLDDILAGNQGPLTPKMAETLATMRTDALYVEKHISNLVSPETASALNITKTSTNALLKSIDVRFRYFASVSEIDFRILVPETDVHVYCDVEAIRYRVFNNLVDNAIRHTPPGGHVEIGYSPNGAKVTCFVKNVGGTPIPSEIIPHLFERGSRNKQSRSGKIGLSGLGLFNVAKVIEAHQGTIGVKSSTNEGTIFEFTLPKAM